MWGSSSTRPKAAKGRCRTTAVAGRGAERSEETRGRLAGGRRGPFACCCCEPEGSAGWDVNNDVGFWAGAEGERGKRGAQALDNDTTRAAKLGRSKTLGPGEKEVGWRLKLGTRSPSF